MTKRYALITGASSGIGLAFATHAAQKGWHVALAARRGERLKSIAQELTTTYNVEADVFPVDLSAPDGAQNLLTGLAQAGRNVDCLINNAGTSIPQRFDKAPLIDHAKFITLSITAPTILCHGLIPHMTQQNWGRIIHISSIAALSSGGKGHALYPAAKSYLLKFSQSLNAELSPFGIFSTAVIPAFVSTNFQVANGMAGKAPPTPQRFTQTPQAVAEEAWRRNDQGTEIVAPGLFAKTAAAFMRALPEPLTRAITRAQAERFYIGE